MKDFVILGPIPPYESCEQVGDNCDYNKMREECRIYRNQLIRMFPLTTKGYFGIKSFSHEFGTYMEVVAYYDDADQDSLDWVYNIESNLPLNWDEIAKKELKEKNQLGDQYDRCLL